MIYGWRLFYAFVNLIHLCTARYSQDYYANIETKHSKYYFIFFTIEYKKGDCTSEEIKFTSILLQVSFSIESENWSCLASRHKKKTYMIPILYL